jgi:hypothetical protein
MTFHLILHFLVPGIVAITLFKKQWKKAWLIMLIPMLIDLDHLLATPIYDPNRCSIGFHPLHSYIAIGVYVAITFIPKLRIFGTGLLIHIALDLIDCF